MKKYDFGADFLHPEFKKFVYAYHAPARASRAGAERRSHLGRQLAKDSPGRIRGLETGAAQPTPKGLAISGRIERLEGARHGPPELRFGSDGPREEQNEN